MPSPSVPASEPMLFGIELDVWATGILFLTALAALVTAFAAIATVKRAQVQVGMANLWQLVEQWDRAGMRRLRARVARTLLRDPGQRERVSDEGMDILNTFELLAYLVRSKSLELEDAWINFSEWAVKWWYVYQDGIRRLHQEDPTILEEYQTLVRQFVNYEAEKLDRPRDQVIPSERELHTFLDSEFRLLLRLREREPLWLRVFESIEAWRSLARKRLQR